jgi:hypothetical protein
VASPVDGAQATAREPADAQAQLRVVSPQQARPEARPSYVLDDRMTGAFRAAGTRGRLAPRCPPPAANR